MPARTDIEPTAGSGAAGRVPPHDLQAEESLLGAMMLSAGAHRGRRRRGRLVRLLQARPRARLRRDPHALRHRPAGRRRHRGRRAAPGGSPRGDRRALGAGPDPVRHPGHHQRRALRPHRRGVRPAPPAHRRRRRDRRARLLGARGRAEGARPGRVARVRGQRAPRHRHDEAPVEPPVGEPRPASSSCTSRATPSPARPPATSTSTTCCRGCSPARWWSSALARPWARRRSRSGCSPTPRSTRPTRAVAVLLARDEPPRAVAATALLGGQGRLAPPPQRAAQGRRLEQHLPGDGSPGRGADLDRRQPQPHDHGDPGQGPPAQEPGRRARA